MGRDLDHQQKCPPLRTLTRISVGINVVLVGIVLPLNLVLQHQLDALYGNQPPSRPAHDVTKSSDVTGSGDDRLEGNTMHRYCYKEDPEVCVDKGHTVKKGADGDHLCCGHLGGHLFDVLAESVKERLEDDIITGMRMTKIKEYITKLNRNSQTANFRPAAHVGILPNGNLTGPDNTVPRVQWRNSGEETFLTGGIIHKGDRLTVTSPGYYYVYTGLQFNVDPAKDKYGAVVAYLYRTVNGTDKGHQKLMTSRESSCGGTRDNDVSGPVSTHMAGIFLLRRDDEISVRTASQSLLHRSPTATYLGLHMV